MLNNIFFDTCVYHQDGIDLQLEVIPAKNILFASEIIGAVKGIEPLSGYHYDDTKHYIDKNQRLSEEQRLMIFEQNTRRIFSRLSI